jgi:hypothetical protein
VKLRRVVASHGLGNQLFQFCFAHNLIEPECRVRIENNLIWSPGLNYSLNRLKSICTHLDIFTNPTISHSSILGRLAYRLKIATPIANLYMRYARHVRVIENPKDYFTFRPTLAASKEQKIIYQGFWTNWNYVFLQRNSAIKDIQHYLDTKVKLVGYLSKSNKNLILHVRRGDYLERGNDSIFGIVTAQSYKNIVKEIKEQFGDVNIITLTDDFNLSNNNLYGEDFGHILPPNLCDQWQALNLMSRADIVVSANSTLSWWGAVLATINGGMAYIPANFYKNLDTKSAFDFPALLKYKNSHY